MDLLLAPLTQTDQVDCDHRHTTLHAPTAHSCGKSTLARLIVKRRGDGILFSEALAEEGAVVFAKACKLGLEGIVSKRAGSLYRAGEAAIG
jgi:hypothetical protein